VTGVKRAHRRNEADPASGGPSRVARGAHFQRGSKDGRRIRHSAGG
jgi:hypothetical protein